MPPQITLAVPLTLISPFLSLDLDIRALLVGARPVHVLRTQQAEEHVVVVEPGQGGRNTAFRASSWPGLQRLERLVRRGEHDVRPLSSTESMLTAVFSRPTPRAEGADVGMLASALQTGNVLPVPSSWAPLPERVAVALRIGDVRFGRALDVGVAGEGAGVGAGSA